LWEAWWTSQDPKLGKCWWMIWGSSGGTWWAIFAARTAFVPASQMWAEDDQLLLTHRGESLSSSLCWSGTHHSIKDRFDAAADPRPLVCGVQAGRGKKVSEASASRRVGNAELEELLPSVQL
jgi:hypothetical protein